MITRRQELFKGSHFETGPLPEIAHLTGSASAATVYSFHALVFGVVNGERSVREHELANAARRAVT